MNANAQPKTDLTGRQFGWWTVENYAGKSYWNCVCQCGKRKAVLGHNLTRYFSRSCRCRLSVVQAKPKTKLRRQAKTKVVRSKGKPNPRRIDLTGQRFGMLTVMKYIGDYKWECICDCGGRSTPASGNLRSGGATSCGCVRRASIVARNKAGHAPAPDLTGQQFTRWLVLAKSVDSSWRCVCDCGAKRDVAGADLRNRASRSCGCLHREKNGAYRKYDSLREREQARAERRRALYAQDAAYRESRIAPGRRYALTLKGKATRMKTNALRRGLRTVFSALEWQRIQEAWDGKCAYCQCVDKMTMDHLVAVSMGGDHVIDNIVPACHSCNARKYNFPLDEALERMKCVGFYERLENAREYLRAISEHAA